MRLRTWNQTAIWCVLALLTLAATQLCAQVTPTGTISGVVKDKDGLPLPGSRVTVLNTDANLTRTVNTASDGTFRFPALPVGHYSVKAELTGFKTRTDTNLTLDVTQEVVVNFSMEVGSVQEEVWVQADADAARVDTTSSSLGSIVDNRQVQELPLNGRNFIDLTLLQPGVTQFQANQFGVNGLFGEFFSSNGAPIRSNMYTLDGAIMGNIQGASASSIAGLSMGLDGISEYKVMTNNFSAEYGLVMGSQTAIVTKSGTNSFHGDLFEYLRNSALDARNYFDVLYTLPTTVPGGGRRLAPFERNQFGGSLGGPIQKDKTFFFGTYEGFREVLGNPPSLGVTPTIPAACHTPVVNGVQIVDNTCDPALKPGATEKVAPAMQPILALWPLPNIEPGDQFTYLSKARTHEDYVQGRVDHNISNADTLFGRYTYDNTNELYPKIFPLFDFGLVERQQYFTLSENHLFSPSLLNTASLSFSRSRILDSTPSTSNPNTQTLSQFACVVGQTICPINISTIANFSGSSAAGIANNQTVFSFGDNLFWNKGKHGLKFGTLLNRYDQYVNEATGQKGTVSFSSLQSFLLGKYRSYTTFLPGSKSLKDMLFYTVGMYVQDEYRVMPRLTLNLGLRYEFNTQPTEKNGRESYFADPPYSTTPTLGSIVNDPTYKNFSPRLGFAYDVFGNGRTSMRGGFGILYDVANFGLVFGLEGLAMPPYVTSAVVTPSSGGPSTLQFPFPIPASVGGGSLQGTSPTTVNRNYTSPHMWDYNFAIEQELPWNAVLTVAYAGSHGMNLWQPVSEANPRCPTSNSFVPRGCEAVTTVVPNSLPVWANASAPRLNPFFGNFSIFDTRGISWYNALEVNASKRMAHGFEFQVAYTFSKLLDDTEGLANADTSGATTNQVEDPFNPMVDYGPANFDVKHNLHINMLYHLPQFTANDFLGKFVNGWWTGSIVSIRSGQPFSPMITSDREQAGISGTNGGLERPSYVTAQNIAAVTAAAQAAGVTTCPANSTGCVPYVPTIYNPNTVITGNPQMWFNPNMFTLQPVGTIGDVGRNILREPGLNTWDFSLNKDTAFPLLGDAGKFEFRAEMFNVLNHPNFGPVVNPGFLAGSVADTAEHPIATQITSTSTPARQIQFSLKVIF